MPFTAILRWLRDVDTRQHVCEIARHFREQHAEAMADELSCREIERAIYLSQRRELDELRVRLRAAERHLMRHGLDMPEGIDE